MNGVVLGDIIISVSQMAKLSLQENKLTAQIYTSEKGGHEAMRRVCPTPQSAWDGMHSQMEGSVFISLLFCSTALSSVCCFDCL